MVREIVAVYNPHRFSGYPGAICLNCGMEDEIEACLAEHNVSISCVEGHVQCEKHPPGRCSIHVNPSCPGPTYSP